MQEKTPNKFVKYLLSKISVDDRALNIGVWESMASFILDERQSKSRLQIVELGGGIGSMFTRIMNLLELPNCDYYIIDQSEENIIFGEKFITDWAHHNDFSIKAIGEGVLKLKLPETEINVHLVALPIYEFIQSYNQKFNLLIAHAFLDLLDINFAIPKIFSLIESGGGFYFTINYDGETIFQPAWDTNFEKQILLAYNQSMDQRIVDGNPSGDSYTGRHMFGAIINNGGDLLAAGSSDWVVYPVANQYIQDEEFFLHFIIETIENALENNDKIDQEKLGDWANTRHHQIDNKKLIYIAHQLDFFGVVSKSIQHRVK